MSLNPLVTLLAILFLAELLGIAGAILAVPVAAAAQISRRPGAPGVPPPP